MVLLKIPQSGGHLEKQLNAITRTVFKQFWCGCRFLSPLEIPFTVNLVLRSCLYGKVVYPNLVCKYFFPKGPNSHGK